MKHSKSKNLNTVPDQKLDQKDQDLTVAPAKSAITAPETQMEDSVVESDIAALAAEARELTDAVRVGDDLRFVKGRWSKVIGEEKNEIGPTMPFVVDVLSYKRGWIRWWDRLPTFKLLGRPVDGFVSPPRDRLGDYDKNKWQRSKSEPQDPWQETFTIVARDLTDGRLCTWTTSSWFGQKALGALLAVYVRNHKQHPGLMPVVLLSSETKSTVNYGDVAAPVLTVVDWKEFGADAAPPGMRNLPPPPLPTVQDLLPPGKETKMLGEATDDEVPF